MKIVRDFMKYFVVACLLWVLFGFFKLLFSPHPNYSFVFVQGFLVLLDAGLVYMWWVAFPEQDRELAEIKKDIAESKERLQAALKNAKATRTNMLNTNEKELFDKLYDQL